MKIFFDSSAFAKRYLVEQGTEKVEELYMQALHLGLSIICIPEIISAFTRLKREKKLSNAQYRLCKQTLLEDVSDAAICLLTPTVIAQSIHIMELNIVRAMDALHVACALEWKAELFVTADQRQLTTAKRVGLNTSVIH